MRWSYNLERSRSVAAWLFLVAALVVAMVVVVAVVTLSACIGTASPSTLPRGFT